MLFAAARGYLDKVKVKDIAAFNEELLSQVDPSLLQSIKAVKDLRKDGIEDKLYGFMDKFTEGFVARLAA